MKKEMTGGKEEREQSEMMGEKAGGRREINKAANVLPY